MSIAVSGSSVPAPVRRRSPARFRRRRDPYLVFAQVSGGILAAFSLLILFGWAADLPAVTRTFTSSVPVKINTAVSFLILGLLLLSGRIPRRGRSIAASISLAAATLLAILGLTTAAEHLFGLDLVVDQLFGPDRYDTVSPGRMSLNAALTFPLLGASVLLARRPRPWAAWSAQLAALLTFLIAYLALLGYAFGVSDLYKLNSYTAMAPQSAIAMLLASLACLARGRRAGLMTTFASAHSGGSLLRWMLAPLVLLLPSLAWLCLLGLRLRLHEPGSGLALYATLSLVILAGALWLSASALNRMDARRRDAERLLLAANESLERRVRERTQAVHLALAQREEVLQREKALRRELDHRVRNNLAGLMGLVALYERSGRAPRQLASAVRGKILAMKDVHDTIARAAGRPVLLADLLSRLIRSAVPEHARRNFSAQVPDVPLKPGEAAAFAMIIQELATNSLKYGALSTPSGRVHIRTTTEPTADGPGVRFEWKEQGCPTADSSEGTGIGLQLIRDFARSDLHGSAHFTSDEGNWRCIIISRPTPPDATDTELGKPDAHPAAPPANPPAQPPVSKEECPA